MAPGLLPSPDLGPPPPRRDLPARRRRWRFGIKPLAFPERLDVVGVQRLPAGHAPLAVRRWQASPPPADHRPAGRRRCGPCPRPDRLALFCLDDLVRRRAVLPTLPPTHVDALPAPLMREGW